MLMYVESDILGHLGSSVFSWKNISFLVPAFSMCVHATVLCVCVLGVSVFVWMQTCLCVWMCACVWLFRHRITFFLSDRAEPDSLTLCQYLFTYTISTPHSFLSLSLIPPSVSTSKAFLEAVDQERYYIYTYMYVHNMYIHIFSSICITHTHTHTHTHTRTHAHVGAYCDANHIGQPSNLGYGSRPIPQIPRIPCSISPISGASLH